MIRRRFLALGFGIPALCVLAAPAPAQRPPLQEQKLPPSQAQPYQRLAPTYQPGGTPAYSPGGTPAGQPSGPSPYQPRAAQNRDVDPGAGNPPAQVPYGQPPAGQASGAPSLPAAPDERTETANNWVPAAAAKLQALDKVNAQASSLVVKVGQSTRFGSLTITVKSCVVRPPGEPQDAAAYLDVTDSDLDSLGFNGWMLANEPSVSMMQHPIYDLRISGCA